MRKWKCSVCGYIHEGELPPDKCPVCGADSTKFEEVAGDGTAETESRAGFFDKLVELMLKKHLHPIAVHTPNGVIPVAVLFLFLAVGLKMSSFEVPAFYNMAFVLLAMPVVLFSGYIEWQKHYGGAKTSVFMTKITCGLIVIISIAALVIWRLVIPDVAAVDSPAKWLYFLLHLVPLAAAIVAGELGGSLVFGRKKK